MSDARVVVLTSLNPFCSKRLMISLTRPRWTPSLRDAEAQGEELLGGKRGLPPCSVQAACA